MNDSLSVSSSYSSSNNSNSNSLNRSLFTNGSFLNNNSINTSTNSSSSAVKHSANLNSSLFRNSRYGTTGIEDFLALPMTPIKRRSKSQIVFYGDEINTIAEHNKQLIEDLYMLKKQLKEKDKKIDNLNDIRNKLESEIQELSASLFEVSYSLFIQSGENL